MATTAVEVKRKAEGLALQLAKPTLPAKWNYEDSVTLVKARIFKWCNLTEEIAQELWIAREKLSEHGGDRRSENFQRRKCADGRTWSDYCQDIGCTKSTVNRWLSKWFPRVRLETKTPALPATGFNLIYADPPWQYDFAESPGRRGIEYKYPTMTTQELIDMKIRSTIPAVLYLWATNPKLVEALEVMAAWGFTYVTNMVWVKDKIGMGYWARQRHELLLIGKKGDVSPPEPSLRPDSVIEAPRKAHSAKPQIVYELLERLYPSAEKLELFARSKRPGWTCWGNEV